MFTGVEGYGIGINKGSKMQSLNKGLMNPNQAYQSFVDGGWSIEKPTKNLGKEDFTPIKPAPKPSTPMLTRNGRIVCALLIVGFGAYAIYRKYQAEQAATNEVVEQSAEIQTPSNNETITTSTTESIPAPSAVETGEAALVTNTAPQTVESQIG